MNRKLAILICALALLGSTLSARAGDVLDRIVATVNGHIILQSDWDAAVRYTALVENHPLEQVSPEEHKAGLDRLIDQELLREQMRSAAIKEATPEEVEQQIREFRAQCPRAKDDQAWQSLLARYGFTEAEIKQRFALQLDLSRLVDERFRPGIDIDAQSIESYYSQELLPQLRQSGARDVALAEVTPQIKEVLTQQKVNELPVAWLQNLRSGSEIQTDTSPADSRDGSE